DTLTNKTYDTAGTGNSLLINGVAATANTGTGSVVRATSPTVSNLTVTGSCTGCGGAAIGSAVTNGTNKSVLYVDSSGSLAQQPAASGVAFEWDPTNQLLTAGRLTSSTTTAVQIGQFQTVGSPGAVKVAGLYAL